jgi:menaquinone-dependent protoporphyrinogen oxidase
MTAAVHVLVAFASQNGSTAGIAGTIASELHDAGLEADCRPVAAVNDLAPYDAVVLGSGVFLVRSASDGGGFIAGHRDELARRPVWLFSAGPIGAVDTIAIADPTSASVQPADGTPVMRVAQAIGARGVARFGHAPLPGDATDARLSPDDWGDVGRVRAWARSIAVVLRRPAGTEVRPADRSLEAASPVVTR